MCGVGDAVAFAVEFGTVEKIDRKLRGLEREDQAGVGD